MLLNYSVVEDSWESLVLRGDQTSQSKWNKSWIFIGRTDAEAEAPILWAPDAKYWLIGKDWERSKAGGEGDDRRWDGWMASPTQLLNSLSKFWELVVDRETWSAAVHWVAKIWHDWVTELKWTEPSYLKFRGRLEEDVLLLLLSCFSCVRLCATPWTAAYQASPSTGFSRQEHWSGLPFPSPKKMY